MSQSLEGRISGLFLCLGSCCTFLIRRAKAENTLCLNKMYTMSQNAELKKSS